MLSRSATLGERLPDLPVQASADAVMEQMLTEADFGDLLLALVAAGRGRDWDAESALRMAARRRIAVIRAAEGLA